MPEHMLIPVEWKTATTGDPGELDGYASVFGNVDLGGDVVLPGAFRKTLADWRSSKLPLPLIADHDLTTGGVIGSVAEAKEDGIGLRVRARFSAEEKAQSIRRKMIEGHLKGMSFTYDAIRHYMGELAGKSVRYLQELRLFEATVTPFPMNTLALASAKATGQGNITTPDAADLDTEARAYCAAQGWAMPDGSYPIRPANMHGATDLGKAVSAVGRGSGSHDAIRRHIMARAKALGLSSEIPANWTASGSASLDFTMFAADAAAVLGISYEPARKAALDVLVAGYHPDDVTAGPADGQSTVDADAPTGGTAEPDDAAAYALAVIAKPSGPPDGAPGGEPPVALAGPLAHLETERAARDMDRLEAEILSARGGTP